MNDTPPSRKGLARASLILGLLGLFGLGPVAGIPAVIAGHVAFRRNRDDPSRYGGRGLAVTGFTLGYVSLLSGLVVAVLVASVVVPGLRDAGARDPRQLCRRQLRDLGIALRVHADDHGRLYPTNLASLDPGLVDAATYACPARPARTPYELLQPGGRQGRANARTPLLRCPGHGHRLLGDGTVE